MIKVVWMVRIVALIMLVGTMGSIDINRIDFYTAFLQILLGCTLLILSNYWHREAKLYEKRKAR